MQVCMCDQCGAIIGDEDTYIHVERNAVDDDGEWAEEVYDLCSFPCVAAWAGAR